MLMLETGRLGDVWVRLLRQQDSKLKWQVEEEAGNMITQFCRYQTQLTALGWTDGDVCGPRAPVRLEVPTGCTT